MLKTILSFKMEDILENLRNQIEETRKLMDNYGVKPYYIIMGETFYNDFIKFMKMLEYNEGKEYLEIKVLYGLEIIVDKIQPNVVYILDYDNGKRIYEYQQMLNKYKNGQ